MSTQSKTKVKRKEHKLTPKQRVFVQEYVKTGNATQAAVIAYDTDRHTASVMGCENLGKPSVREGVESLARVTNESLLELMTQNQMMQKAIESAYQDLLHEDSTVVTAARKFLLDCHKAISPAEPKQVQHKHAHVALMPKR